MTEPSLYQAIAPRPFDPEGWLARGNTVAFDQILGIEREESPWLLEAVASIRPRKVRRALEIGSYKGLSARYLAAGLPEGAVLYCVDPWNFREGLFHTFLSNTRHAGLEHRIVPVRATSAEAATLLEGLAFDLIYIDGSHLREDVELDCHTWWRRLAPGGLLCGDDYTMDSVAAGVDAFAAAVGVTVCVDAPGHFWWIDDAGSDPAVHR